jgi:ParB-like nuclease domain
MAPVLQDVPLTDIALDDRTFIVTYRPDLHTLQRSIAQVGVLTPLHLRRGPAPAQLQVVCGAKRLQVCQQTGRATVPALVHNTTELPDEVECRGKGENSTTFTSRVSLCSSEAARGVLSSAGHAAAVGVGGGV